VENYGETARMRSGGNDTSSTVSDMDVAVLVLDGVFDSGLAAVLDVVHTANELRGQLADPPPPWRVRITGLRRRVRTGAGHLVTTEPVTHDPELLVVPGVAEKRPDQLIEFASGRAQAPARLLVAETRSRRTPIAAACTATFLLAEAGILDDRRATTSWWLAPVFRARYPAVALDDNHMLVRDDGITTAGAAFAHVDLALSLVAERSPTLADLVARYLVVDHRPSQGTFAIPSLLAQTDPVVSAFERWVRENLAEPLRLPAAARALGTSERTLQRAVQRVLGKSPVEFVQDVRLEQAAHLLRTTDMSAQAVSRQVGYENAGTLRTLLRRRRGTTVAQLRGR
jgi:transcriptional regulator GlxA family with amidase domain